jgi:hypothetical protein
MRLIKTRSKLVGIVLAGVLGALSLPAAALAQDGPTSAQYEDQVTQVGADVGGGAGGAAGAGAPGVGGDGGGALPFTGADLGILAAVAASLGVAGYGLRRLSGSRERA